MNAFRRQQNLSINDGYQSEEFDSLCATMRRRPLLKDVLARKMRENGIESAAELSRRAAERGKSISPTAIKEILRGNTTAPSIDTLEAAAIGMNMNPLQLIAEILGDKTEDPNFKTGQFAVLADLVRSMTPSQRAKAEPHIDGLTLQLTHIKNQK